MRLTPSQPSPKLTSADISHPTRAVITTQDYATTAGILETEPEKTPARAPAEPRLVHPPPPHLPPHALDTDFAILVW